MTEPVNVEELRWWADHQGYEEMRKLVLAAADELERLRSLTHFGGRTIAELNADLAELERLREENDLDDEARELLTYMRDPYSAAAKELVQLRRDAERLRDQVEEYQVGENLTLEQLRRLKVERDEAREELVDLREENERLDQEVQDVLSDYATEATENANAQTELADWRAGRKTAWTSFDEREPEYGKRWALLYRDRWNNAPKVDVRYWDRRYDGKAYTHWAPFNPPEGVVYKQVLSNL